MKDFSLRRSPIDCELAQDCQSLKSLKHTYLDLDPPVSKEGLFVVCLSTNTPTVMINYT